MFREEIRRWSTLFMLIACLGCLVSCSGSSDKGTKSAEKVYPLCWSARMRN